MNRFYCRLKSGILYEQKEFSFRSFFFTSICTLFSKIIVDFFPWGFICTNYNFFRSLMILLFNNLWDQKLRGMDLRELIGSARQQEIIEIKS